MEASPSRGQEEEDPDLGLVNGLLLLPPLPVAGDDCGGTELDDNDRCRDPPRSVNGENGSDADVSSLSSLDGLDDCRAAPPTAIGSLKRLAEYRRLQSTGSTLDEHLSSVSSSCEADKSCNGDVATLDDRTELKGLGQEYDPQKLLGRDSGPLFSSSIRPIRENGTSAAGGVQASSNNSGLNSPEAVLDLEDSGAISQVRCRLPYPEEDTHIFSSTSAAAVTCELNTEASYPFARLQEELRQAQAELKIKDEEVGRLKCLRDEVGAELEDLTASLFQEAHRMVRDAKVKRDAAEKSLKEANMKIEVLQAEVQALKTLVITSTPSMPNRHLHPQLDSKGNCKKENDEKGGGTAFLKGHKRSPSHNNLKYGRETTPPGSPVKEIAPEPLKREEYEVDPVFHHEFVLWKENPTLDKNHPFLVRIYREDISPCLNFANVNLAEHVHRCIEENSMVIETVSGKSPFPKRCAMLDTPRLCKYRMKFGDSDQWHYISELCRNRIAATCNFLSYLRYIQQGLVKSSVHEVYGEILRLRKQMALAKLGFN